MYGHSIDTDPNELSSQFLDPYIVYLSVTKGYRKFSEKSYSGALADYFKGEAALSKFGSSEELIDSAAEDLVCLPLGKVSDDRALAFYPLRVAANLRQRDRVLIRPLTRSPPPPTHLSPSSSLDALTE